MCKPLSYFSYLLFSFSHNIIYWFQFLLTSLRYFVFHYTNRCVCLIISYLFPCLIILFPFAVEILEIIQIVWYRKEINTGLPNYLQSSCFSLDTFSSLHLLDIFINSFYIQLYYTSHNSLSYIMSNYFYIENG